MRIIEDKALVFLIRKLFEKIMFKSSHQSSKFTILCLDLLLDINQELDHINTASYKYSKLCERMTLRYFYVLFNLQRYVSDHHCLISKLKSGRDQILILVCKRTAKFSFMRLDKIVEVFDLFKDWHHET